MRHLLGLFTVCLVAAMTFGQQAQASFITAFASIPLLGEVDRDESFQPNDSVGASVGVTRGGASAHANTSARLGALAFSNELGLFFSVNSSSSFSANYAIQGNPGGVPLPLTFQFRLDGHMEVTEGSGVFGATALMGYSVLANGRQQGGQIELRNDWVNGVQWVIIGDVAVPEVRARVQPKVLIGVDIIPLIDEDLADLGLPELSLPFSLPELDANKAKGELAAALAQFGLPRLGIGPFSAELGLDVTFEADLSIPLAVELTNSGGVAVSLSATALGGAASASSDWQNTLRLEAITLPSDFQGVDVNNLAVVFDSGLTMPVQRESISAVPEPGTLLPLALGLLALAIPLRRRKTVQLPSSQLKQ